MFVPERNPKYDLDEEKPPVHEFYTVKEWFTITKSTEWWTCLVLVVPTQGGAVHTRFYVWQAYMRDGNWKNRYKATATKWDWEGLSKTAEDFCAQSGA